MDVPNCIKKKSISDNIRLNDGRGKQQFEISMKQVFSALNSMMKKGSEPQQILVQGSALKYLPSTISDVMTVMDPHEIR